MDKLISIGAVILSSAVENNIKAKNIHIAGHSLGGQLMSFLAKKFTAITGEPLGR